MTFSLVTNTLINRATRAVRLFDRKIEKIEHYRTNPLFVEPLLLFCLVSTCKLIESYLVRYNNNALVKMQHIWIIE